MKNYLKSWRLSAIVGVVVFASLSISSAAVLSLSADKGDHDRARAALEAGEIVSLNRLLSKVERIFNGTILEVELAEGEAEAWGDNGEKTGEHADKGKGSLPGIAPVNGPVEYPVNNITVPPTGKHQPPSSSGGGYAAGEGAATGNNAEGGTTFIYRIKLLSPQGNVLRIEFNAKSMEMLGVAGRNPEAARKKR